MEESKKITQDVQQRISQMNVVNALSNPAIPKFYATNFIIGRSENDMFIMSVSNNKIGMVCNMSFQAAKKLLENLKKNIDLIESSIGEIKSIPNVNNNSSNS